MSESPASDPPATPREPSTADLVRTVSQVSRESRRARNGHRGGVVWLTGLSGSGKSTLAGALERELFGRGCQAFVLDGDNIRFGLSADLGFSTADRAENIRRVSEVAKLFAEAGLIVITAFISPFRSDRLKARRIMQDGPGIPFCEVYLSTPLEVCERRDPKRLYARARAGEVKDFTGISSAFEPPDCPELSIDTSVVTLHEAVALLLDDLSCRVLG